jgi:hypothetical protein
MLPGGQRSAVGPRHLPGNDLDVEPPANSSPVRMRESSEVKVISARPSLASASGSLAGT